MPNMNSPLRNTLLILAAIILPGGLLLLLPALRRWLSQRF